jgi:hypothetical protein
VAAPAGAEAAAGGARPGRALGMGHPIPAAAVPCPTGPPVTGTR